MQTTIANVKREEEILASNNIQAILMLEKINASIAKMESDAKELRKNEQYTTANNLFKYIKGMEMAKQNMISIVLD